MAWMGQDLAWLMWTFAEESRDFRRLSKFRGTASQIACFAKIEAFEALVTFMCMYIYIYSFLFLFVFMHLFGRPFVDRDRFWIGLRGHITLVIVVLARLRLSLGSLPVFGSPATQNGSYLGLSWPGRASCSIEVFQAQLRLTSNNQAQCDSLNNNTRRRTYRAT